MSCSGGGTKWNVKHVLIVDDITGNSDISSRFVSICTFVRGHTSEIDPIPFNDFNFEAVMPFNNTFEVDD